MRFNNFVWRFFASIQLAIFLFIALASTSIIGTIIPQHQSLSFYAGQYGNFLAQLIHILEIQDMYNSWWFSSLLFLLIINLVVCSIDRYPLTRNKIRARNIDFTKEKLSSMPFSTEISFHSKLAKPGNILTKLGWKTTQNNKLLFSEKFAWSNYGVYLVHLSIIVIFAGAMLGNILGYKGSVMIPETLKTDQVYSQHSSVPIPLDFEIRCDDFAIEYYDSGMVKDYHSKLSIFENGQKLLTRNIEVNKPLIYKGVTFYQASYKSFQSFIITIIDRKTGEGKVLTVDYQKQTDWPEKNIKLGILNISPREEHVEQIKLWFFDGKGEPVIQWLKNDTINIIKVNDQEYEIKVEQLYATGLQATKDPGVWLVYLGCAMLLLGFYICFFLSHKKIWLLQDGSKLLLAGTCNKNRPGFEKEFNKIKEALEKA